MSVGLARRIRTRSLHECGRIHGGQDEAFCPKQKAGPVPIPKEPRLAKSRRPSTLKRQKEQKRLARALEKREARAQKRVEGPKPESEVPEPEVPEEGNPPDPGQELDKEE